MCAITETLISWKSVAKLMSFWAKQVPCLCRLCFRECWEQAELAEAWGNPMLVGEGDLATAPLQRGLSRDRWSDGLA